jgi:FixJ family two-component response regulator
MIDRALISVVEDDQPFRESMKKLLTALATQSLSSRRQPIF